MFNRKSEYALNKKVKDFIVYSDAYGNITRLSAEDFSSVKEFRKWKNWTMMKNHADEKKDHRYRNHSIPFSDFDGVIGEILDTEHDMIAQEDFEDRQQEIRDLMVLLKECLSETQYRRMWMYYVENKDTYEIAELEGISHQAVSDCIQAARKRFLKYLKKRRV
ncbi:MAG: hypothetical protein ACI3W5_15985 [Faecousia sp.]